MHAITIDGKEGHEFEGEQEGVWERGWREEKRGRMVQLKYNLTGR